MGCSLAVNQSLEVILMHLADLGIRLRRVRILTHRHCLNQSQIPAEVQAAMLPSSAAELL